MQLNRKSFLLLVVVIQALAGCRQIPIIPAGTGQVDRIPAASLVTMTTTEAQLSDLAETPSAPGVACVPPYLSTSGEIPSYQLMASIDIGDHVVLVEERIIYPNTSSDSLDQIPLVVEPSRYKNVFSLESVRIGNDELKDFSLESAALILPLASPLPPGCTLEIRLEFRLTLPEQPGLFGYTEEQLVLTNWYPFIPPYQSGKNWQVHPPARYGEHLVYPLADFTVSLTMDKEISDEIIAAPAPAQIDGQNIRYELNNARTFSLAVLPGHRHIHRIVDGIEFHVYFKPDSSAAAQAALDTLVGSAAVFSSVFGDYPFESLTTAQIDMFDGMEYDGIFFLGRDVFPAYDYTNKNIFTLLVAHETSHNWWFSQVGNDQAMEPWLDEAMATYCELLFLEQNHPELVEWWWDFRVLDAYPVGPVDVSIYDYFDYERYRLAVYLRGALFLQAVRDEIGDDAFFSFLEQYYLAGKGKIASADLFFATLEQISEQDLDHLRIQFFKPE